MDYTEFSGKSLESAISEAGKSFSVPVEGLDYEIVDMGTSGFLGFNSKPTVIRAKIKDEYLADMKKEEEDEKTSSNSFEADNEDSKSVESVDSSETVKSVKIDADDQTDIIERVDTFLSDLFEAMNMEVSSQVSYDAAERCVDIDLSGPEMGILIGKRGQTLDSVQYLVSLIVNKGTGEYIRVKVDTEDYRSRRQKTLENLAHNLSFKVKRTRRPVTLEPMNPYERRIIHSALQGDRYVTTHSEGEEPFRRVVITLKK